MFSNFVLSRSRALGLSITEIAKRAGISRETLYRLMRGDSHQITLKSLIGLASALEVAPLHVTRLIYHEVAAAPPTVLPTQHTGDHASFVRDVTVPDDGIVPAGQEFVKTWEVQNTGTVPWRGRTYRCMDEDVVLARRHADGSLTPVLDANLHPLQREVPCPDARPGGVAQVAVHFRAPPLPCTAMSLWKMHDSEGRLCFPQFSGLWCKVRVMSL